MSLLRDTLLTAAVTLLSAQSASAAHSKFSGTWSIDLRTVEQRAQNAECRESSFVLKQSGSQITGSHTFATVGCGRVNEGGEGTVKGRVIGNRAHLIVISGRNGAVVKGVATLKNKALQWETKEEIKEAVPRGDSPLILGEGRLSKVGEAVATPAMPTETVRFNIDSERSLGYAPSEVCQAFLRQLNRQCGTRKCILRSDRATPPSIIELPWRKLRGNEAVSAAADIWVNRYDKPVDPVRRETVVKQILEQIDAGVLQLFHARLQPPSEAEGSANEGCSVRIS